MSVRQRVVNTIPSRDAVLRRVVDRVTAEDPPASAAELADQLRRIYPRVGVFERQLSGERSHLYVYRDGRYEPDHGEAWWKGEGVARACVSRTTGRLTSVTGPWASLMRSSEADLVGRPYTDFVSPAARSMAQAMFEAINEEREVQSKAIVTRPDGTVLPIEFRAIVTDAEIDVAYRPLDGADGEGDTGAS
ncbi:MAG TPA: PAS domain-containing protein [Candidatus Limnocylindria bacterium]|nr:PAS domain-containing protein [Candidatus Limnocylindria bacterium]